ncbi:MAG: DUF1003 domain-containing protein [Acidimicrobiales bacterium]
MSKHWAFHPSVRSGDQLTLGERAADHMRGAMGSWPFVFGFLATMAAWATLNSLLLGDHAFDRYPYILLNLFLSMMAGLQGAILLISAKRADQIAAELALHDHEILTELQRHTNCMHATPQTGVCSCPLGSHDVA